jgi:hypothetical protein
MEHINALGGRYSKFFNYKEGGTDRQITIALETVTKLHRYRSIYLRK